MSALRHRRRLMKWHRYMARTATAMSDGGWHNGMRRTHHRAVFSGRPVIGRRLWYMHGGNA